MKPEIALVRELIREKASQRVFAKVFDQQTILTVHALARKGLFDRLEHVIKTGKEGHVFRAVDKSGNYRAVKVYKIAVSDFKNMFPYIQGDPRFTKVKRNRRAIVNAWTQKEYKNLWLLKKAGIRVPVPFGVKDNVLVMEFIGKKGIASASVKTKNPQNMKNFFGFVQESLTKMVYTAKLVHADFSEYNILNNDGEFVVIDVGQGVLLSHPRAREYFKRDVYNISHFLSKKGFSITADELLAKIRETQKKA